MNVTEKQAECLTVMARLPFVDLTTMDRSGFPSTRAMLNLRNPQRYPHMVALHEAEENPLAVYLTTNASSVKCTEIQQDPRACLYYCEYQDFHGILLQGMVEIVTDNAIRQKAWQKGWEVYYPKGDSDYALLRFIPDRLKTYFNFAVATEIL